LLPGGREKTEDPGGGELVVHEEAGLLTPQRDLEALAAPLGRRLRHELATRVREDAAR
jgi:hypothetical protein